jgi:hypothetical protein
MTTRTYQRELRTLARQSGWSVSPTRGGHLRLTRPGSGPVFAPATPSDWRALPNVRAEMKRRETRTRGRDR